MVPKLIKIRKYFALRGSFAREWGGGGEGGFKDFDFEGNF